MLRADHAAFLSDGLDDVVGLVALEIGQRARIRMGNDDWLRRRLDGVKHSTLSDMGEIDGDAQFIHDPHGIPTEERETCLLRFEAAITKCIPEVVGELHDPKPEPPEEIEAVEIVGHRPRVLPAHDEADLALRPGPIKVSGRLD